MGSDLIFTRRALRGDVITGRSPRARRRAAPLDLSLGHIGTTQGGEADLHEIDIVAFGPYVVTLDYDALVASVQFDSEFQFSRSERREAARELDRLLRTDAHSGMRVLREVAEPSRGITV